MPESGIDKGLEAITKLESIGFVEFTTNLVRDVYRVIVEASMEQLNAYADFVAKIAKPLTEYQIEVLGDSTEQDKKASDYIKNVLGFSFGSSTTDIPLTDEQETSLQQHFLGVTVPDDNDANKSIDISTVITEESGAKKITLDNLKKFVIAKLKKGVKDSYDLIKTILKIGMQKVVVTNGEIRTKLTFHVDATDTYTKTASEYDQKASNWGISGFISGRLGKAKSELAGRESRIASAMTGNFIGGGISGGYGSSKLKVKVVNETSTAATNINIDILGEVKIIFRTDTFPSIEV